MRTPKLACSRCDIVWNASERTNCPRCGRVNGELPVWSARLGPVKIAFLFAGVFVLGFCISVGGYYLVNKSHQSQQIQHKNNQEPERPGVRLKGQALNDWCWEKQNMLRIDMPYEDVISILGKPTGLYDNPNISQYNFKSRDHYWIWEDGINTYRIRVWFTQRDDGVFRILVYTKEDKLTPPKTTTRQ